MSTLPQFLKIYDKIGKDYNREKTVFSVSGAGKTGYLHAKELN